MTTKTLVDATTNLDTRIEPQSTIKFQENLKTILTLKNKCNHTSIQSPSETKNVI